MKSFRFLLSLVIFDRLLSITKSLSDALQSTSVDLVKAADLVLATTETLEEFRSEHSWDHLFTYVENVANLHTIDEVGPRPRRKRLLPNRLQDAVVLEYTGSMEVWTTNQQFKVALYYPILDAFLTELKRRFNDRNVNIMRAIQACSPVSTHFLELDYLQPLADCYDLDCVALRIEAVLAKCTLTKKKMECTAAVLKELSPLKEAFPTLLKLLQIALTICVSTASYERSFSSLKRIYLRSTMHEERLVNSGVAKPGPGRAWALPILCWARAIRTAKVYTTPSQ